MSNDCVFCKIARKELPAHVVYEDDNIMAVLDHRPVRPGHTLIITKEHIEQFTQLTDEQASKIVVLGNKLAHKILNKLKPKLMRVGFVVHGAVPHVHYHVIPQWDETDIASGTYAKSVAGEVVFDETIIPVANDEDQAEIANILK